MLGGGCWLLAQGLKYNGRAGRRLLLLGLPDSCPSSSPLYRCGHKLGLLFFFPPKS